MVLFSLVKNGQKLTFFVHLRNHSQSVLGVPKRSNFVKNGSLDCQLSVIWWTCLPPDGSEGSFFIKKTQSKSTFFVHHQNHSETLSDGPKWSYQIKRWSLYISLRFLEIFVRKMVKNWLFRSPAVGCQNGLILPKSSICFSDGETFQRENAFQNAGDAPKRSEAKRRVRSRIKHKM